MQGKKTHEQLVRTLERKPDIDDPGRDGRARGAGRDDAAHSAKPGVRQSEWPVSRGGMNQESDHNKHNDSGQRGHKAQRPEPAQQKQSR